MRYVCPAAVAVAIVSLLQVSASAATPPGLSVTNYHLLTEVHTTRTLYLYTYSADLVNNTSLPQPAITATVTSLTPGMVIQSGLGSLHFPSAPANSTVTSTNFFSVMVDRTGDTSFTNLVWAFNTPVANAGPNQTAGVGATVTLNGTGSTNPTGVGTLTYSWAFAATGGRPAGSTATLLNPTSVSPTFIVDKPGSYVIVLTVSNGAGQASSSVTITTTNTAPVANAGPDQPVSAGATVTLNGSGSSDVDGDPLTYAWLLVQVPSGSAASLNNPSSISPVFVADKVGTYKAQLIVNDGHANSTPSQVTITSSNTRPIASAGNSQSVLRGALVQLNGSGSSDADGNPLTYRWSLNSVPAGSTAALSNTSIVNPTFTADLDGSYVAQLIVNDGFDDSVPVTVTISTNAPVAPTANAGPNQTVTHGAVVQLAGSGTDPQSRPLAFHWSLITRPTGSIASLNNLTVAAPMFTADLPGNYVAQLIVDNGVLNSAPSTVTITTTNTAPVANAGPNQIVSVLSTVVLNGGASSDADHDPITYSWSLQSAPAGSTATLFSPSIVSPTFVPDVAGPYVIQLIVNDGFTSSSPSTVMITAQTLRITLSPDPLNILSNAPGTLTVAIPGAAPAGGQLVRLAVIDGTVVTVPATVTIPEAQTSTTVSITPVAAGTTQILASASGLQPGSATINVTQPSIGLSFSNSTVGVTKTVTGTITLSSAAPAGGVTIGLTASVPGIVSFPLTVSIASGTTGTFTLTGVASGTTLISAASASYIGGSASITATLLGAITLESGVRVVSGQSVSFDVSLVSPAPSGGVTINLVSSDPTKLTVSPSVTIAAGATSPSVPAQVTGVNFGVVTVTASSQGFSSATSDVTIAQGLVISPNSLPDGTVGSLYPTTTISATGGTPPYTRSVTNLPNGLSFDTTTGIISGQPNSAGTATITLKDSSSPVLSGMLYLKINPAILMIASTPTPLPDGTVGLAYPQAVISATGGTAPYVFTATPVGLRGLDFNPTSGVLGGTPTSLGIVTITVKDSAPTPQTASLQFSINPSVLMVNPSTLPVGTANSVYPSTTIVPSGGTAPYILSATGLPTGMTFNAGTGLLNGTPTVPTAVPSTAKITIKDSASTPQTITLTLTINPATLTISPNSLPPGTALTAYPATTITAAGGTQPYTFSASNLPAGMSFDATTHVLSGTPSVPTTTAKITVTDSASTPQIASVTLTINPAPFSFSPATANLTVGTPYAPITFTVVGGTPPYTLSKSANLTTLGLAFDTATGVLSGTPTSAGTATITATDSATPAAVAMVTITVVPPVLVVTPSSLPNGAFGAAYPTTTISVSGGTPPYIRSATNLPAGMSFDTTTGVLSGTPMGSGTVTITVMDSGSTPQVVTRTFIINSQLMIGPATLTTGIENTAYPNTTITASGGTPPYTFTSSGLPTGISFDTTSHVLGGTPTATGTGSVTVTDSTLPTHLTASVSLTIAPPPLTPNPATLPNGAVGAAYPATTVTASGGTPPYTRTVANLPAGMSFDASTGLLSGTPQAAGTVTITITDVSVPQKSAVLTFTINQALMVNPASLPPGAVGAAYVTTTVSASGGTPPYILSATGVAGLGLSFNTSTGVLSGTPTIAGTATITVTDSTGPTPLVVPRTLTINPMLMVAPNSLPVGTATVPYTTTTVSASGGTPPYTFSATSLPAGLSFNTSTGVLSGTPGASGTATITVTDSTPGTHLSVPLMLTVNPKLTITPNPLPTGVSGVLYPTTTVVGAGGMPPYTFSSSGLPAGLSFNPSTGVVSGTPSTTGTGTITVTDSTIPVANTAATTLTVGFGPLVITSTSVPAGTVNVSYSATVLATGGTQPYTFSAPALTALGLSIRNTGQITGVPTTAGTFSVPVTVTDSATSPASTTATFSLVIAAAPLVISTGSLPPVNEQAFYNQTLAATGGTLPYTWSLTGTLPSGLTFNPAGRISGFPSIGSAGTYNIMVSVTDSGTPHQTAGPVALSLVVTAITGPTLTVTGATVGKNLETSLAVNILNGPGSQINVNISSDNPNVVFSKFAGTVGTQSLAVNMVVSNFIVYAQGLSDSGTANVTVHASGFVDGTSVVTLSPSGFVFSGPNGLGGSLLLNASTSTPLSVIAKQLDSSGNVGLTQQVRAGLTQAVTLSNSAGAAAGSLPTSASFTGGTDTVTVNFISANVASNTSTVLSVIEPSGFATPVGNANVLPVTVQIKTMTPGNVTVGKNLEATTQVTLSSRVTATTVVHLTSLDPTKALLSATATGVGSASLDMTIACNAQGCGSATQPFYVYALADSGTVGYTATAPSLGTATGLITLAPSGFIFEGGDFFTVTGFPPSFLNVDAVQLDSSGNPVAVMALAGGQTASVVITSSIPGVGTVTSPLSFSAGVSSLTTQFNPVGPGTTLLTVVTPSALGYTTPATMATLNATVRLPGILISDGGTVGKNLQLQGTIFIGAPAPAGGAPITLTATTGLLLSATPTTAGNSSIIVTIPAGQTFGTYYMFGTDSTGTATVTATSSGYNSSSGTESLAPSAVVIFGPFGPGYDASATVGTDISITASTYVLDSLNFPVAEQALAPTPDGSPLVVGLQNGTPSVGTIAGTPMIQIGSSEANVTFTPLSAGSTLITASRPVNFTSPSQGSTLGITVFPAPQSQH